MEFSENTRVKIPALVHATRLGYKYISLKEYKDDIDEDTNIFKSIFKNSINKINNKEFDDNDIDRIIKNLSICLSNEDLGKSFYKYLINGINGIKLVDFNNENNNTFNVVTELTYKNNDEEFRPDVIMLINGMPLGFIEVKKPNNRDGILAERKRINTRFKNKKFTRFINITQVLIFSNNMEYNDDSVVPIEGAFYATPNYGNVFFNPFREERIDVYNEINSIDGVVEDFILKDNNYVSIKGTEEYLTNLSPVTPTNRIITSIFHKTRILKLIKYGIAYVEKKAKDGITHIEKHIMRYQQFFATLSIEDTINKNIKKGVIWHTQGSGKTALAYFNVLYLTDYFQSRGKVAKFYFVVDRISLLEQAKDEFSSRGLVVSTVSSKEEFKKSIKEVSPTSETGEYTINVINIQKFSEESIVSETDYNVGVQRIYFLDEAHRSYNPHGSFLANLFASDRNAIFIGLTGTPLITDAYNTKDIFGDYIHKYYYNKSIQDGYTLKLIREGIETSYRTELNKTIDEIKSQYGLTETDIFEHPTYTKCLTEYIVKDFKNSKNMLGDDSIGGMIVCDSSNQARNIFKDLNNYDLTKALILYDEDDKQTRENEVKDFKNGKIDILVVYNMLLTGFDAPRLKKLYLGRVIKSHNLLQTLTRVNRPYKDFKYGYVVDFADITEEFDRTNKMYFQELHEELGSEFDNYSNIFLSKNEIEENIKLIENKMFDYDTSNLENFTKQINELDKTELNDLKKTMITYKDLYNVIKAFNYTDLVDNLKYDRISKMIREVQRRIDIVNLTGKENLNKNYLLNVELGEIEFNFKKISEEELVIADKYQKELEEVRKEFLSNIDKDDIKFINLYNEYESLFKSINMEELTVKDIDKNSKLLNDIKNKIHSLNESNNRLLIKYQGDDKYVLIHKRVVESIPNIDKVLLNNILLKLKNELDDMLLRKYDIMDTVEYFRKTVEPYALSALEECDITENVSEVTFFTDVIVSTYLNERKMEGYE